MYIRLFIACIQRGISTDCIIKQTLETKDLFINDMCFITGECTRAICGGVSSIMNPQALITLCKARYFLFNGNLH